MLSVKLRVLALLLSFPLSTAYAKFFLLDMDFEELMDKQYVTIASGSPVAVNLAPAVATVITETDIRAMGATDLDQVLQMVPGLYVSNTFSNYNPIYAFRGIYSQVNTETLLLLNGIPMTSLYRGDRGGIWGGMPVRSIARIEIIRGPGSAVYGADAFGGVINIITKSALDIPESEIGAGYGSFNSRDAWLLAADRLGDISAALSIEYSDTDGHRERVHFDHQSWRDEQMGTDASFAPGPVQLSRRALDLHLDLRMDNWLLRGSYQGRDNVGNGAGFYEALDPQGRYESTRYTLGLQYSTPTLAENWELQTNVSLHHIDQQVEKDTLMLPPGSVLAIPAPTGLQIINLPNGLIGNPQVWENNYRFDVSTFYTGFENHRIRLATGYYFGDIYRTRETKNFMLDETGSTIIILPRVTNLSGTPDTFLNPADRENLYLSLQDEWRLAKNWHLTSGLRYDRYSDFGDTFNPRLALVWETTDRVTSKFLYGRAFRAPSLSELYSTNPVAFGNPNLDPQSIDTYEFAINVRASTRLQYGLNLFHYDAKDLILYRRDDKQLYTPFNEGNQKGYGGELEISYTLASNLNLFTNYSYVTIDGTSKHSEAGNTPEHQVHFHAAWNFAPEWQLTPQISYVSERARGKGDPHSAFDEYVLVNLALQRRNLLHKVDGMLVVRNLLDQEIREPGLDNIPDGLPKAGISLYGSLSYRF